jgi:aspartate-semialdehyde dehydrogenase
MAVSASCHRVAVSDGHLAAISIELEACASPEEVIAAWEEFRPPEEVAALPSAPVRPLAWRREVDRPQPKLDRDSGGGMTVTVGRLRPCPALADTGAYSFEALSHNTIRGAAGGTLLLAELCAVRYGLLDR